MPIENIDLTAAYKTNKNIVTATIENNNSNENIVLEKSVDGIHFEKLGVMNLISSSATTQQYQLFDENITAAKNYYRARINDNGTIIYSKIIVVENNRKVIVLISPNPAKNVVNISFKNLVNSSSQIKIFNAEGKLLLDTINTRNNTSINTSNFASGMYVVEILQNGQIVASEKLVVKN